MNISSICVHWKDISNIPINKTYQLTEQIMELATRATNKSFLYIPWWLSPLLVTSTSTSLVQPSSSVTQMIIVILQYIWLTWFSSLQWALLLVNGSQIIALPNLYSSKALNFWTWHTKIPHSLTRVPSPSSISCWHTLNTEFQCQICAVFLGS